MTLDREKVIKGLERCIICDISVVALEEAQNAYRECEYTVGLYCGQKKLLRDAITLLKEQEAVTIKKTKEHGFGVYGGVCPKCRNWIQSAHSFCGFCGQAVKWDG